MKMKDEKKIYRFIADAFDEGLIEPSEMSPAELGKKIQDEYEANPPTLIELMRAYIYMIRLKLNRKK
jgi:hypothetical protein